MYRITAVLLVLTGAHAVHGTALHAQHERHVAPRQVEEPIPDYSRALDTVSSAENLLLYRIGFLNDESEVQYLLILNALRKVAKAVSVVGEVGYDLSFYPAMLVALADVVISPESTRLEVLDDLQNAYNKTLAVSNHLSNCNDINLPSECDNNVAQLVQEDPDDYKKPARLLLDLATIAGYYYGFDTEFSEAASKNKSVIFLADSKEYLKPMIIQMADAYNKVDELTLAN